MSSNPEDAFGGAKKLLGIVDMIYAAVQEPELWGTTLQQITATMQGESIAIFAGYEDQNTPNVFSMQEMAEEAKRDEAARAKLDEERKRAAATSMQTVLGELFAMVASAAAGAKAGKAGKGGDKKKKKK